MVFSSPLLKLALGADVDTLVDPDHNNRPNGYLENLATVLIRRLCGGGLIARGADETTFDAQTGRIAVPDPQHPLLGIVNGQFFVLGNDREATGTANSGTTLNLVDAARAEAQGFWQDGFVLFTSGANAGQARKVTASDPASGTLSWETELPQAVQAGDAYVVTFFSIQGLTAGALNYIFGRATDRTAPHGVLQWVANTTEAKAEGDFLVGTLTLDAQGAVVEANDSPEGVDRCFFPGVGQVHTITLTGTIEGLEPAASVEITRTHDELILFGPLTAESDNPDCSIEVVEGWQADRVVLRLTNNHPYSLPAVSYSVTRKGRKLMVL